MGKIKDLTGQKFGRLTVLKYSHAGKNHRSYWNCICDCGKTVVANGKTLLNGDKRSCGCLRIEHIKQLRKPTHGMRNSAIYKIWAGMINRCENRKDPSFYLYGGRGIAVCAEWRHDVLRFSKDMGERPKGYSLDRIDNSGSYSKENCRWASSSQQANNRRNNKILTADNKSQTIAQWARDLNINSATIWRRLNVYRWSIERALSKKNHVCKKKTTFCVRTNKKYIYPKG